MAKYLNLFLFLAHASVSALYTTDFHESNDARAMALAAKRAAAVMFYRSLPSTTTITNDMSSLDDLNDLEVPPNWGYEPYELEEVRPRFVRAPPLPRLGKFRRYLEEFKDLGRSHDWTSSTMRGQKPLSPEAGDFFREAVCTEFGDVKEFSLWCKQG